MSEIEIVIDKDRVFQMSAPPESDSVWLSLDIDAGSYTSVFLARREVKQVADVLNEWLAQPNEGSDT